MEPKTPEEVYKTWLESAGSALRPSLLAEHPVDSARQNLSATFVNAFVNAGFGRDKLVTTEDGNKWMYKNKDHGTKLILYTFLHSYVYHICGIVQRKCHLLLCHSIPHCLISF